MTHIIVYFQYPVLASECLFESIFIGMLIPVIELYGCVKDATPPHSRASPWPASVAYFAYGVVVIPFRARLVEVSEAGWLLLHTDHPF